MSVSASKGNKRTAVYLELKKASQAVERAIDSLATTQEGLAALNKALKHVVDAGFAAEATTLTWKEKGETKVKVKRDALPAGIRRKISNLNIRIQNLMGEVKAIPVTRDEKTAQVRKRGRL